MKRALITGITGQDGAYLASLLLKNGYAVVGGSPRRAAPNYWRLEELGLLYNNRPINGFELLSLDVTDPAQVASTVAQGKFDEVYNLAAMSFVPASFDSPYSTFSINAVGALNILSAIKENAPGTRFYQAGTSEMFGLVNVESQNEDTPFHPRSPYAVAKAAAYYAVQNYREAYGLHASTGILFNHESPLRGEEFVTRKISRAVARIVTEKQLTLALGDMTAKRDWGYAYDYVYGMWLMLQQDTPDDYVLATGQAHSVQDAVQIAFEHVGLDYEEYVVQDEAFLRPSDVPLLCGDATKAREKLGWQPACDFHQLIKMMVDADLNREGVDPILLAAEMG